MTTIFKLTITILFIAFQLNACSTGGGSSNGGSEGTGLTQDMSSQTTSSGAITGFGSIFVNGVEFELDVAEININDNNGSEDQLQLGMFVVVQGEVNDDRTAGNASSVHYDQDIEGPITAITSNNITSNNGNEALIVVLGVNVHIDGLTVLDNLDLSTIAVGQVVEVSGFRQRDNSLLATRIEKQSDTFISGSELEIEGRILSLDSDQQQLVIAGLTIDFSQAQFSNITENTLIPGLFLEVKGSDFGPNNELIASSIELEDNELSLEDNLSLEVEGIITDFDSLSNFTVGNTLIDGRNAIIENGSSADLVNGIKVEVEGVIVSGELQANKIKIKQANTVRITAPIAALDSASNHFTVLGISAQTSASTLFEDKSETDLISLHLDDMSNDQWVEVRGSLSDGLLLIARLERIDEEDEVELRAPIEAIADSTVTLAGLDLDLSSFSSILNSLTVGMVIEVDGTYNGNELAVSSVEIEN